MNLLTFLHRWIGVVLALFMLFWLASGSIIAFVGSPSIDRADRLTHGASLAPEEGWLSLGDALRLSAPARAKAATPIQGLENDHAKALPDAIIVDARLARIDGAPFWQTEDDRGRRFAISARDGKVEEFSIERAERIARNWIRQEGASGATALKYVDTSDAPVGVRNAQTLKPFYRFALADGSGTNVIVSARSGEVAQVATQAQRAFSYAGAWLHLFRWLDLFGAGEYRRAALSWAGFFAATGALTGLILGWIRWRPGFFGRPTYARGRTQPYREFWFKYHFWAGLNGGSFALLWAVSGYLSTNPWQIFSPATANREELARYLGSELPHVVAQWKPDASLAIDANVVELGWGRLGNGAVLVAYGRDGARQALTSAQTQSRFDDEALLAAARRLGGGTNIASNELLSAYDSYYFPGHRQGLLDKPLPVLRVDLADAGRTSLYIDPLDGRLLARVDARRRAYRWLYSAIHNWDFGFFHHRIVWYGWMATWVGLGLALAASAVVLGWRRLRRTISAGAIAGIIKKAASFQIGEAR
jgi:uncharacterized iron-regulated membrane protein